MGHSWSNNKVEIDYSLESGSLLGKWITPRKISHLYNTGPDFGKLVTRRKVGHTCKNGSYFQKKVTLGKTSYTWKSGSHFEKWVTCTLNSGLQFKKWVTLRKAGHTSTLEKNGNSWKSVKQRHGFCNVSLQCSFLVPLLHSYLTLLKRWKNM